MTASVELLLPPWGPGAAVVRRSIEDRLAPHVSAEAAADRKLVATELVTNAIVHGEGQITVRLQVIEDAVRVEVIDGGTRSGPAVRQASERGGWGLRIVDTLSRHWGVGGGWTHFWAEVPR